MRLIETSADVAEGAAWLAAHDPRFAGLLEQTGPLPLRLKPSGFHGLLEIIISQQVSVASARAIWGRMEAAGMTDAGRVAQASEDDLRACGLSRQKIRYSLALASADINYGALRDLASDAVIARLIEVPGIGRWTAEVYAMFSLGRTDVFAPGDLALQEAARLLFDLDARPSERDFRAMSCAWAPWRAVAARLLWAYYAKAKDREGIAR